MSKKRKKRRKQSAGRSEPVVAIEMIAREGTTIFYGITADGRRVNRLVYPGLPLDDGLPGRLERAARELNSSTTWR